MCHYLYFTNRDMRLRYNDNFCLRILLNCGVGEDSSGSLGLQGDQTNPKGNQPWTFIGKTDAEAEAPILWPPDAKTWCIGKDPDAGEDWRQKKRVTEDEMVLPTQWTWVGANSRREWRTGTSELLPSMAKRQTRLSDGTRITVRRCGAKTQIQVCLTPELHEYLVMMLHTDF